MDMIKNLFPKMLSQSSFERSGFGFRDCKKCHWDVLDKYF